MNRHFGDFRHRRVSRRGPCVRMQGGYPNQRPRRVLCERPYEDLKDLLRHAIAYLSVLEDPSFLRMTKKENSYAFLYTPPLGGRGALSLNLLKNNSASAQSTKPQAPFRRRP